MNESPAVFIGISQCLLGDAVRYDGGHKRFSFCTDTLAPYVRYVPVCPELAIGLGTPREAIHLRGQAQSEVVRLVGNRTPGLDVTQAMQAFAQAKAGELDYLSGYIFKAKSPSCGPWRIPIYHENGSPLGRSSPGLYAQAVLRRYPLLPVEDEGRLRDESLRENFVARVFAYRRWQELMQEGLTHARLQDFHARHKYTLLAHRQAAYKYLGKLVAQAHLRPLELAAQDYIQVFMDTLKLVASNRNHSNVLQHLMGYLKQQLDAEAKQELIELIDQYRAGDLPLIAPLTLLRHHFKRHPHPYIARQVYLEPYPATLMLRSFI